MEDPNAISAPDGPPDSDRHQSAAVPPSPTDDGPPPAPRPPVPKTRRRCKWFPVITATGPPATRRRAVRVIKICGTRTFVCPINQKYICFYMKTRSKIFGGETSECCTIKLRSENRTSTSKIAALVSRKILATESDIQETDCVIPHSIHDRFDERSR